ncbi:rhomboid family peptidase [Anaerobacterium chartisolvens]|uniref:Rhomboid family peptidase n=1 Tax=Anaerobacterium chartisolvens TaxID=1297424 RepID=A0A369BI01_9FIRM|nr:rhomboid family intramembrane serine protease [Anaerobacterium chartisolvens]RCX21041.1 rhomboid family peptidase [Anaerobacterium chartisolvens]
MMKQNYINLLLERLIDKRDYLPIRGQNGEVSVRDGMAIVEKTYLGNYMIVEIIDGDRFSKEEIAVRLEKNKNVLMNIDRTGCFFFDVIIFDSLPDEQKLSAIREGQYMDGSQKRALSCITVNLSEGAVEKQHKFSSPSNEIDKLLKACLKEDWKDTGNTIDLEGLMQKKQDELSVTFVARKPFFTYTLIIINIAVSLLIYLYQRRTGTDFNELLSRFGAKNNMLILQGEYWRFITPVFLHGGPLHLIINCYSLYVVGVFVERLFGHAKFACIYFAGGILGNIASFMFSTSMGVGASGAIFGLMGAMLYYGMEYPAHFRRYFGHNIIITIVVNIAYGFSAQGIDNYAHLGGLAGGFLASGVVGISKKRSASRVPGRLVFFVVLAAMAIGGLYYGFNNTQNSFLNKVTRFDSMANDGRWTDIEELGEDILSTGRANQNIKVNVLIYVVQAELNLGKYDEAAVHAKEILPLNAAWGHYTLGVIYFNTQQYELAEKELIEARSLNPSIGNIDEILNLINKNKTAE